MVIPPVQRLCRELEQHAAGIHPTPPDFAAVRSRIARHVLHALNDYEHPFTQRVQQLRRFVKALAEHATPKESSNQSQRSPQPPHHVLFMPQPGQSDSALRRFWPIQLLLAEAAQAGDHHTDALADRLALGRRTMDAAVQKAIGHSLTDWSRTVHLTRMAQALALLDVPFAEHIELDGRDLRQGGNVMRLSPQEQRFYGALAESRGDAVSHASLKAVGVTNPIKIKHSLMRKAERAGLVLRLQTPMPGHYQLDLE